MKLNVQGHLKWWLWHLASLLWAEHKFNGGVTGLRKAEKMAIFTDVLGMKRASTQIVPELLNFDKDITQEIQIGSKRS